MEKGGVKGVVLDDSVLVASGEADSALQLLPGAESLLRHLRRSRIPTVSFTPFRCSAGCSLNFASACQAFAS